MITLSGYQSLAQIYESANSVVYRGKREQDNQSVILKVLKEDYPTPSELTRYKQEYEIIRNLNTDGVVKAYGLESYQKTPVIILEDFGASSLKQLMNGRMGAGAGALPLPEFLYIAIAVAGILGNIHSSNVIHKDINPANIVYNPETGILKIIDFGISTVFTRENPTLKNPNVLEGTLAYMSPEQTGRMNRTLDYRTDFYSLGVTFYELLTGQLPFDTTDALELVHCHIAKQPMSPHQLLPEMPLAVSDIVMKLMAKTAQERYQSAWGIKADLEECLNQLQRHGEISSFSLGTQDISDQFHIPQKLYGREAEVETLLAAFERVSSTSQLTTDNGQLTTNKIEMMLVAGYSGIGKSSLVVEIHKPNTRLRGYFTEGKFDQFQRNIPYSAVVSAFTGLVRQLLTESEAQLNLWREKLLAAFGSNGQVIIDVIPEVELIVGEQPPVPELGPTELQNRFNLVFSQFIRAFCTKEHPLVIFLDDLQWADSATLKLIELMMMDASMQYLFLIGAYRDNEVSPTHPLMMTLDGLRNLGATVNFITLAPLALKHISQLIADTLHSDTDKGQPLAELVMSKTGGNPFFVNQFLKTLYLENLLTFNYVVSDSVNRSKSNISYPKWDWDIAQIKAQDITDNVVELMISRLKKLPESTQLVLRLAACIGAYFDLDTISIVCEKNNDVIFHNLVTAIQSGLILPISELDKELLIQDYKFLHDRVQQAAYALIDESQKKAVHLQIGRLLWQSTESEALSEEIFEIVDHLNQGVELVTHQAERDEVAKLNLMAGQKAKAAAAYTAAKKYFATGIECLTDNIWAEFCYELTFALHKELAECEYLLGSFEEADNTFNILLINARSRLDKAEIYSRRELLCDGLNRFEDTIQNGRTGLALFGITLPELNETELLKDAIAAEFQAYQVNLAHRKPEELLNLSEMQDLDQKSCISLLMNMTLPAYFVDDSILMWVVIKMVNISIGYGNTDTSSFAYIWFATILCGQFDDYQVGYEYGRVGLELIKRYENAKLYSMTLVSFSLNVNHWRKLLRTNIPMFKEAFQVGLDNGDMVYATNALYGLIRDMLLSGENLDITLAECEKTIEFMIKNKNKGFIYIQQMFRYVALMLKGALCYKQQHFAIADDFYLGTEETNEEEWLSAWLEMQFITAVSHLKLFKMWALCILENYQGVLQLYEENKKYVVHSKGQPQIVEGCFSHTLALAALYPSQSATEKQQYLEIIRANQDKIKLWADNASENFLHKYLLVEAEIGRITGRDLEEVMSLYDRAICTASKNGFIHNEALANELAAKFWLAKGKVEFAQPYMRKAKHCYQVWGAKRKVEDLEEKYPQLLNLSSATSRLTDTHMTTTSISTSGRSGDTLDLATFMKASQAISGEIVLDKLLTSLMKILIENAGAQTGFLILDKAGEWVIEASGEVDSDNVTVLQSIPINQYLPASIINYVTRTKETLVENDAAQQGKFTNDPYIKANKTKSILCAPLINQGQLGGIVYLENNLTGGAFTSNRLEVIQLLSGQAAIAITNAKLYAEVSESERRLTQYLEAMPMGVAVHTPGGQLHYANQTAQQLLGINVLPEAKTEQMAEAYQVYRAGTQELYPTNQLPIVRSLSGEMAKVDDMELHQPDKIVPLEVSTTPIFDETGKIVYAIAAFQDISDRKQAEKLLAEYNRTLEIQVAERTQELSQALDHLKATQEELIQSAKMAALGQLIAGIAHEVNTPLGAIRSSAGNISKFLDQTLKQLPTLFQSLSREDSANFLALLQQSLQQESTFSTKEERHFKRALKHQLEAEEIENADTIADTLVTMGIYNEVDAFLLLLKRPDSSHLLEIAYKLSELKRGTATINTATDRASKVVFALKTYTRYDQSSEMIPANLTDGIETVLTLYQNQLKQGVEVERSYAELPPVLCYPDELNQVWTNLIHNALQAMDYRGTLTLEVTTVDQQAKISITDSGKGIPEEIQSKIFEPFFTTKPPGEGSGLGLDIVKKIIDKHSGQIAVESKPGRTTFNVFLPIQPYE